MRAAVRHEYGSPDVIRIEEVETPTPAADEVLVRVRAASVNLGDWELLTGDPFYYLPLVRIFGPKPRLRIPRPPGRAGASSGRRGPFLPRYKVLGYDFAGTVEAVGRRVTQFKPGDEVFGDSMLAGFGAFAEYVCVRERSAMIPKPADMTFEEAAALPEAAFNALQALCGKHSVKPGHKALINGAGGSVGTLAIQIAKASGAEVTGVDAPEKESLIRSLGADHFIDYTKEDFTRSGRGYDVILDVVATRSVFSIRRALNRGGVYTMLGGGWRTFWQSVFLGPLMSLIDRRKMRLLPMSPRREDLTEICERIAAGAVKPVIDRTYTLDETGEAIRRLGEKRSLGKVIVTP